MSFTLSKTNEQFTNLFPSKERYGFSSLVHNRDEKQTEKGFKVSENLEGETLERLYWIVFISKPNKHNNMRNLLVIALSSILFVSCQNTQENETGSDTQTADDFLDSGMSKYKILDYKGAIADFAKAIELDPNDSDAYLFRGGTKEGLQDYRGAVADYNKAIELTPNNSDAYHCRGSAKRKLEDYRGAIADYNKAIELNPNNSDAYFFRGDSKLKLNQKDSGCLDLSKAGELGHEFAYDIIRERCN